MDKLALLAHMIDRAISHAEAGTDPTEELADLQAHGEADDGETD